MAVVKSPEVEAGIHDPITYVWQMPYEAGSVRASQGAVRDYDIWPTGPLVPSSEEFGEHQPDENGMPAFNLAIVSGDELVQAVADLNGAIPHERIKETAHYRLASNAINAVVALPVTQHSGLAAQEKYFRSLGLSHGRAEFGDRALRAIRGEAEIIAHKAVRRLWDRAQLFAGDKEALDDAVIGYMALVVKGLDKVVRH